MATDLTKMVEDWMRWQTGNQSLLYNLLKAMAKQIEANREEIRQVDQQSIGMNASRKSDISRLEEEIEAN